MHAVLYLAACLHHLLTHLCLRFSSLCRQCILLPQQHVYQHFSGVQWHTKLCLSLGWKQLQRYSSCAKVLCNYSFYNDACRVRLCCVTLSLLEEVFCVVFLPDTTEQSILNSGQMLDGTEYSFKRNSWQENNYLIIFTAFAAKRPSKPFGCLVAL